MDIDCSSYAVSATATTSAFFLTMTDHLTFLPQGQHAFWRTTCRPQVADSRKPRRLIHSVSSLCPLLPGGAAGTAFHLAAVCCCFGGRPKGQSFLSPQLPDRLVGLVVKASASRAKDPGIFPGSSHTSDLKIGTPVATLPGASSFRVSAGTGLPGVGIL